MRPQISPIISLLIMLSCFCFISQAQEDTPVAIDDKIECGVVLEGNNAIRMPDTSFSSIDASWTYPFPLYPIYSENQSISGSILCQDRSAGSDARVYISRFDLFDLLSDKPSLDNGTIIESSHQIRLNDTGDAHFVLGGISSGLYIIRAMDAQNTTVLATTPALITRGEFAMNFSSQIKAGDILQVDIKTPPSWENTSKIFGAIMIYGQDYATAKIDLTANDTVESLLTTISIGNKSMQVQGMPRVSNELLMDLLAILPRNSTLAVPMQESTEQKAELYLLTDADLPRGEYVLTCAIYAPGNGLMGLRQGTVEVV